jgi:hypothetical protein
VDGLLLKFTEREPSFWKLFGSIRQDLDRLYWVFLWAPWLAGPLEFQENSDTVVVPFRDREAVSKSGDRELSLAMRTVSPKKKSTSGPSSRPVTIRESWETGIARRSATRR